MLDERKPPVKVERRPTAQKPLGQWLVENVPRGLELELPDRENEPEREIPFQGLGVDAISPWEPLTG